MKLTNEDFTRLFDCAMAWGLDWKEQADRFEPTPKEFRFQWVYWFDSYSALLLARLFLDEDGWQSESLWDEDLEQWILLTNYEFNEIAQMDYRKKLGTE